MLFNLLNSLSTTCCKLPPIIGVASLKIHLSDPFLSLKKKYHPLYWSLSSSVTFHAEIFLLSQICIEKYFNFHHYTQFTEAVRVILLEHTFLPKVMKLNSVFLHEKIINNTLTVARFCSLVFNMNNFKVCETYKVMNYSTCS